MDFWLIISLKTKSHSNDHMKIQALQMPMVFWYCFVYIFQQISEIVEDE